MDINVRLNELREALGQLLAQRNVLAQRHQDVTMEAVRLQGAIRELEVLLAAPADVTTPAVPDEKATLEPKKGEK